jgi:hypothetical protein
LLLPVVQNGVAAVLNETPISDFSSVSQDDHVGPRPDSLAGDRLLIERTATAVTIILANVGAAAAYIASGGEFAPLHEILVKNHPKDRNRIGWRRAFSEAENQFGLSRRTAEAHIDIHAAFSTTGNMLPAVKLPQSLRPLHLLATFKLSADQILESIEAGNIGPTSTEGDIRKIGIKLGKLKQQTRPVQTKVNPVVTKPGLIEIYSTATPDERKALFTHLTAAGLLRDMPDSMRVELTDRVKSLADLAKAIQSRRAAPNLRIVK